MSDLLAIPAPAPALKGPGPFVRGLGVALPATVVRSEQIAARLGVDPGWIEQRTGIRERRALAEGETLTDLAARAARSALDDAQVDAGEVDLVLAATATADDLIPSLAAGVAAGVGAQRAGAVDLGAACTGFLSGLALAAGMLEAGRARCVLLVGAESLTRFLDPGDRRTAMLFGDGAGAVVLGAGAIGPVVLRADHHRDLLFATRERSVIEMDGHEVFKHAVSRMAEATLEACRLAGVTPDDVDLFVYHQANARITAALGRRLGLDPGRVVDCIAEHGNTSAASIPLALEYARDEGRLKDGTRVLVSAFGAGFTWGATVLDWGAA